MKVRYFLRGLGVGILVTTLLLFAGARKNSTISLTDEDIMERASELGMLTKEEASSYRMDENLDHIKESLSETDSPENEVVSDESQANDKETVQSEEPVESSSPSPSKSDDEESNTEQETEESGERETVSVKIESGMVSKNVAQYLYQKNVVGSADDFNDYLKKNHYTQKIIAGTYEIPTDATYAEIVEIIT